MKKIIVVLAALTLAIAPAAAQKIDYDGLALRSGKGVDSNLRVAFPMFFGFSMPLGADSATFPQNKFFQSFYYGLEMASIRFASPNSPIEFSLGLRWTFMDIAFEDTDLDGNPVNSAQIFSQNKVTMINIWATTCGPCIQEMPELEKLNKEFQKKGGAIIGVVRDVPADNNMYLQEAQAIVKDTGVTFLNLKAWDSLEDDLEIVGTPTTYFVDSKGNLIGEPVLGAHLEVYKKQMEKYLSQTE